MQFFQNLCNNLGICTSFIQRHVCVLYLPLKKAGNGCNIHWQQIKKTVQNVSNAETI